MITPRGEFAVYFALAAILVLPRLRRGLTERQQKGISMANSCSHLHSCFECGKPHTCTFPECRNLTGYQRLCSRCSYLYGWAQSKDRKQNDSTVSQ